MSTKSVIPNLLALASVAAVAVGMAACQPRPPAPTTPAVAELPPVKACAEEDGSGADQTYPCQWDARVRGNGQYRGRPVIMYYRGSDAGCPGWGDPMVECVDVDS